MDPVPIARLIWCTSTYLISSTRDYIILVVAFEFEQERNNSLWAINVSIAVFDLVFGFPVPFLSKLLPRRECYLLPSDRQHILNSDDRDTPQPFLFIRTRGR